jgi:hypothetical protein
MGKTYPVHIARVVVTGRFNTFWGLVFAAGFVVAASGGQTEIWGLGEVAVFWYTKADLAGKWR